MTTCGTAAASLYRGLGMAPRGMRMLAIIYSFRIYATVVVTALCKHTCRSRATRPFAGTPRDRGPGLSIRLTFDDGGTRNLWTAQWGAGRRLMGIIAGRGRGVGRVGRCGRELVSWRGNGATRHTRITHDALLQR